MANKLINEQSPYLLQHAHNPVNWYPWSNEAFDVARTQNKPVLVSIGYAACHWCHVMEKESFEDEATAAYMNDHFVCIKVDREEHPDVDHMYMDAVQAIGGHGGWPLNVFVTPERAPFYGGTYFPPRPAYGRPSWQQLLQRMSQIWTDQQGEVAQQAEQMIQHLKQASLKTATAGQARLDMGTCRKIADSLLAEADKENGGFGNAPKFPGTMALSFLLEHYHFTGHKPALDHALFSLDTMIDAGIYDQLGGGFARYATDKEWLIPHFEKMLYDNALLICSLSDAYSLTKEDRYRVIIEETIAFADRELKHGSGGYFCALDADSEGVEGKYYTWTWQEWIDVLGNDEKIATAYYGVTPGGNWEQTNILSIITPVEEIAAKNGISVLEAQQQLNTAKAKLFAARAARIRPQTDDKCLLSWNALMNIAITRAAVALGGPHRQLYLTKAAAHMQWMLKSFVQEETVLHTWKNGTAKIAAKLDDLAYLAQALLQLSAATGDNTLAQQAVALTEATIKDFSHESGFFYYTGQQQNDIPVRKVDLHDGATPSANSFMAQTLWQCGMCMEQTAWTEQAWTMLRNISDTAMRYSYSFGYWALLLQRHAVGAITVIFAGPQANELREKMQESYLPQAYLLTSKKEISELPLLEKKYLTDKTQVFVCTDQACLSPVTSVDAAFHLIMGLKK